MHGLYMQLPIVPHIAKARARMYVDLKTKYAPCGTAKYARVDTVVDAHFRKNPSLLQCLTEMLLLVELAHHTMELKLIQIPVTIGVMCNKKRLQPRGETRINVSPDLNDNF